MNDDEHNAPTTPYTVHFDGDRRIVRQQTSGNDGESVVFQHDFPDAIQHHYRPGGIDEPILLYKGPFSFAEVEPAEPAFIGDIGFQWKPTPRIHARGGRQLDTSSLFKAFTFDSSDAVWRDAPIVTLPPSATIHEQPTEASGDWKMQIGSSCVNERLSLQDFGDPTGLERLTFLVPNGWSAHDGFSICDPNDLMSFWHGRLKATSAGWNVSIDSRRDTHSHDFARQLAASGGHYVTHVGELCRSDGRVFDATDALNVLEAMRIALTLAVGRTVNCILPVGWRAGRAVWTRWASPPVDPYRSVSSWLDETVASKQVSELLEHAIGFCANPARYKVFRYAVSYYVTANFDLDVELAVAVPVSGMQLLAYHRLVEEGAKLTQRQWKALTTEQQVRLLLDECAIDTAIPTHFNELHKIAAGLPAGFQGTPDALGVIVYLRNKITHPTKQKPDVWDIYGWAEACMVARHLLALAILNTVDYQGLEHSPLSASRWMGQTAPVPWATSSK